MRILAKCMFGFIISFVVAMGPLKADVSDDDMRKIHRAALDYLESQQQVIPKMMDRALHSKFAKRTFWKKDGRDFVLENDRDGMVHIAEVYNKDGDMFPKNPRKDVEILDVEGRTASVKVYADEFIDYLHIVKLEDEWKIINALWQYNDMNRHKSR